MATNDEGTTKNAVEQLKKRLKEDMSKELYEDDNMFYRFLKARDFNVDNAEIMLRNHLEFRRKYDVDNISKYKSPEVFVKYLPFVKIGYDKEGCVIRYCPSGNVDWIGLDLSVKQEDFAKNFIFAVHEDEIDLKTQSEKLGKTVDKCVYIFNLDKLSFAQTTSKRVILTSIFICDLQQSNYPETLKAIYVINAPVYFNLLFGILKNFLGSSILKKIKIYSDDTYKEDFLNLIDNDVLPEFLGGNRTDPDGNPLCPSFINHGGPVPETYYIHKSKRSLADLPDAQKITLTRATFHEIYQEVKEPGTYLEWEFEIKCRDIGFGLFYREAIDGEEKMTEIIPIHRIDTEDYSETGMHLCEKSGTYVVVFDNTYSWLRAKEIFYRVKILTPEEQEADLMK